MQLKCYGALDTNERLAIDSAESDICSKWLDTRDIVMLGMSQTQSTDLAAKSRLNGALVHYNQTRLRIKDSNVAPDKRGIHTFETHFKKKFAVPFKR